MKDGLPHHAAFDLIVVGAGASGCALAGRLSENSEKRVLLVEAGPDAPPGREHPDILDPYPVSSGNRQFFWENLYAEGGADPGDGSPRIAAPFIQGFGVGGGSNINGMAADRAQPSDYDEWCDLGADGWAWKDVLPYFRKLERDLDFAGPLHGTDGPIPVRRVRPEQWAPFAKTLAEVFGRYGAEIINDSNGDFRDGVSPVAMTCLPDRRVSASMAYLTEQVRKRPNLTILSNTTVERLEVHDRRVRGVEIRTHAGPRTVFSPEVIVSCGAIHSPTLLMRSGIGPAGLLRSLGIEIKRDLPGVGRNLQNHPMVPLVTHLRPNGIQATVQRPWQQNQLRYSSRVAECHEHDMLLLVSNKLGWHTLGRCVGAIGVFVLKAYSTGSVELVSPDPETAPRVRFNLLADSRDFDRMVHGVRFALETLDHEEVRKMRNEIFTPNARIAAGLARRSSWHTLQASLFAAALNVGVVRRTLLAKRTLNLRSISGSDAAIRQYVRKCAQAVYHVCGTCRMGHPSSPNTVVDPTCRVLGIEGLRVVDASVFPAIPRGQTHFPVLMTAEKAADAVKESWSGSPQPHLHEYTE